MKIRPLGRTTCCFLVGAALAATAVPISVHGFITAAHAQERTLPADFRQALEPYGKWVSHQRWGEVWVPEAAADWQPYSKGHWVYTEEWGWYWVANEEWGWIPYHYGRWINDQQLGWAWVPGREWGPAWVRWRRGAEAVGWAPLPPDEIAYDDEVEADAGAWIFVPLAAMAAPRIADAIVPHHDRASYFRNTVLVNRTLLRERGRIAVNPGVSPSYIAAAIGRPLRAVDVRPRVIPGTVGVRGAIETRIDRSRRGAIRETIVDRSATTIRPALNIPPPQPLARGERGRLGDHPPRAAGGRPLQPSVPIITTPQPGAPPAAEGRRPPIVTPGQQPPPRATEGRTPPPIVTPERTQRPAAVPGAERPRPSQPSVTPQRPAASPPPAVRQPPAAERTPPQQRIAPPSRPAPPAATAPRPSQPPAATAPRPSPPAAAPRPAQPPAAVAPRAQPPATSGQAPRAPAVSAPPRAPAAPAQPAPGGRPDKR